MEREDPNLQIDDEEEYSMDDDLKQKFNGTGSMLEDKEKRSLAYQKFRKNEQTLKRYEDSKKAKIEPSTIQKFISTNYNFSSNELTSTIIASICKIYLAELVEEAREVMTKKGEEGKITPKY
jgi:hypothetical protein